MICGGDMVVEGYLIVLLRGIVLEAARGVYIISTTSFAMDKLHVSVSLLQ